MRLAIGIVVALLILAGGAWAYRQLQIDRCLEAGGAWDYRNAAYEQ